MRRIKYLLFVAAFAASLIGCNKEPSTTSADSTTKSTSTIGSGLFDKLKPEPKVVIPAGTRVRVALIDAVSSDKSRPGDSFTASLAEPVVVDGKTVLEKGTRVRGRVLDAKESGRVKGRASIELTLTSIMRDNGESVNIATKPYSAVAESTKKRDAAIIGGGAGVGAAIGAIAERYESAPKVGATKPRSFDRGGSSARGVARGVAHPRDEQCAHPPGTKPKGSCVAGTGRRAGSRACSLQRNDDFPDDHHAAPENVFGAGPRNDKQYPPAFVNFFRRAISRDAFRRRNFGS